jgi:hypothetical protein
MDSKEEVISLDSRFGFGSMRRSTAHMDVGVRENDDV